MDDFKRIYLNDAGRLNRLRYFKYSFILGIVEMVIVDFVSAIFSNEFGMLSSFGSVLVTTITLSALVPDYFLNVRRLHDLGQNSDLAKIYCAINVYFEIFEDAVFPGFSDKIVVFAFLGLTLYLILSPGDVGENQYGDDPLQ